jgi:DNA-binding transcriptional regulator YiaG
MSQDELASVAKVSNSTVRDFEAGRRKPIQATLAAMRAALEAKGVAFVDDEETWGITAAKPKG